MLKVEDLKIDDKYKRLTPETKEQFIALENLILAEGEIYSPILVWKDQNIVVDGHARVEILKNHPNGLKYTIKEIPFIDWQDVIQFIVEHHIARASFTLWQKLEMAMNCFEIWAAKENAKNNKGTRTDLLSVSDKKLIPVDIDLVIAQKVGCGKTSVTMFKKVFSEASEAIKQRCKENDMSIFRAYQSLAPKEKKTPPKIINDLVIDTKGDDILEDSEKNQNLGKNSNVTIPDPKPIATKMTATETPDGTMWLAINPIQGVIQVFKKTLDKEKGVIRVQVNSFACKQVSRDGGLTILEAYHIDGSTEEMSQKDNTDFDETSKKAS